MESRPRRYRLSSQRAVTHASGMGPQGDVGNCGSSVFIAVGFDLGALLQTASVIRPRVFEFCGANFD